jgi:hypothetical protein
MVVEDCDPAPEEEEAAPTPPPVVVVPESGIRREDYETGDWYHGMFNGALREGKGLYVYAQGPIKEFEGDFKGGWGHGLGRFKCAPLPLPEWQREETCWSSCGMPVWRRALENARVAPATFHCHHAPIPQHPHLAVCCLLQPQQD